MKRKGRGLLENILVLDLANEQGSFCSRLLADLGAGVIKIESPKGDASRGSLSFLYHNTNKLGIVLDFDTRRGKRAFLSLIERADVLVETSPPGSMESHGLGSEYLRTINPRLIHTSITGFGQSGPKCKYQSCESIASAYGGQMHVSGTAANVPTGLFGLQSSYTASLFGANAVLLGLRQRRRSGKGSHVDISIQEAVASTLDHVMIDYFHNGKIAGRQSDTYPNNPFTSLPCKDGYIQITILRNWDTLLELMHSEGKAKSLLGTKWGGQAYREKHWNRIIVEVEEWTRSHTKAELFELGQAMHFPWAPVYSPGEILTSPQLKARHFFVPIVPPSGASRIPASGLPYKFSSFSPSRPKPAPLLGEHTKPVLEKLRFSLGKNLEAAPDKGDLSQSAKSGKILNRIRVVDLTRMLSGPYATRILGDFGAEVIKVQAKLTAAGAEQNGTPYFNSWNRNKRSITLNLSHPEARELLLELVAISDVVVENFSPRVLANWGLTYQRLKMARPDLIMASISAMGQTGPWKDFVGFAPTFHALSGLISTTSRALNKPAGPGNAYGDVITGLYCALAILSSLEYRDATGKGQYIDVSAYEALCTLLGPAYMEAASALSQDAHRQARGNDGAAPCGCYPCRGDDRWCVIAVFGDEQWWKFCRISNVPGLLSGRFSTAAARRRNRATLDELISKWTAGRKAETIARRLQHAGIAAGVVQNAGDLARDRQLAARHFFVSLQHPAYGLTFSDRSALWPWREKPIGWKPAPLLGEDNLHVFQILLGRSEAELERLIKEGVIN